MRRQVQVDGEVLRIGEVTFNLGKIDRICVLGAGKASAAMAQTLEGILGDRINNGCVITKYGHLVRCQRVTIREAGHPLSDVNGLAATSEILELAGSLGESDLAIVLVSGGGSALLELLPESIPLDDARKTIKLLMHAGADISALNIVRKHLSLVKGGQLARALLPCPSITLLISDVIGDPLDLIASGPTVADPSSYADAWGIIERFNLIEQAPQSVVRHLQRGMFGDIPETPKPGDPIFSAAHHHIIANNQLALHTARLKAESLGYRSLVESTVVQGGAREFATTLAGMVRQLMTEPRPDQRPICLLFGGETTVTVRGDGMGGRCQEVALAALADLLDADGDYLIAACGTDGTDGPTDAAGGIACPEVAARAKGLGLSPMEFLRRSDSYSFLRVTEGLIVTGPTGTNVMDVYLALIP